jgi:sucrose-6-phosphate hydrolase SacC (GH32 family)
MDLRHLARCDGCTPVCSNSAKTAHLQSLAHHTRLQCFSRVLYAEACNNPPVYWLGDYNSSTHSFNLAAAVGPFRLDLGKTLYACTLYQDTHVSFMLPPVPVCAIYAASYALAAACPHVGICRLTWPAAEIQQRRLQARTVSGCPAGAWPTTSNYICTSSAVLPLQGRNLLLGWIQEHRRVPPPPCETTMYSYAGWHQQGSAAALLQCMQPAAAWLSLAVVPRCHYHWTMTASVTAPAGNAGCLSIPRCLYIRDGRLFQMPIPEMAMLRTG